MALLAFALSNVYTVEIVDSELVEVRGSQVGRVCFCDRITVSVLKVLKLCLGILGSAKQCV